MQDLLNRFSLDEAKMNGQMEICLVAIWLVVVGTVVSSILSQPFSAKQRFFWIGMVVCVPIIGVLAYLPFSVTEERGSDVLGTPRKK